MLRIYRSQCLGKEDEMLEKTRWRAVSWRRHGKMRCLRSKGTDYCKKGDVVSSIKEDKN